jgi:hypothetical protein
LQKTLPAPDQEEMVAGLSTVDGGLIITGSRFVHEPRVGYQTWVMRFNRLGDVEATHVLPEYSRPGWMLRSVDQSLWLAGTLQPTNRLGMEYDAWLTKLAPDGQKLLSKVFDRGADEAVVGGFLTSDEGCLLVMNSSPSRMKDEGPSNVWLLKCSPEGDVVKEQEVQGGWIVSKGGSVAAAGVTGFAVVVSTSKRPKMNEVDITRTAAFDARVYGFSDSLKRQWQVDLKGYSSFVTPAIVAGPGGGYVVAGVVPDGLRLTFISNEGSVLWEKKERFVEEGVPSISSLSALTVSGSSLFAAGVRVDLSKSPIDEKVFLLKVDVRTPTVLWTKTY